MKNNTQVPGETPECSNLVVLDTVTEIEPKAFYGASWLDELVIPGSVKKIGEKAFAQSRLILLTLHHGFCERHEWGKEQYGYIRSMLVNDTEIGKVVFE